MIALFRAPTFAGGVVTMPYKKAVLSHLDKLDDLAVVLGACNNVYLSPEGELVGTNTDWIGIKGCLLDASDQGRGKPAMIIGAGGASRAAVYALSAELDCNTIYVINRDEQEVIDLFRDAQAYAKHGRSGPRLIHIQSVEQALGLETPFYVVGTVPDFEPKTEEELQARAILESFLARNADRGVLLDMCFKPRNTRILKLGKQHQWRTVEGTDVIGRQIEEQWRLWAGEEAAQRVPKEEAWAVLRKAAEESPRINF
ncbi:hypothetical protein LTR28_003633 [Elasticomyces elasticus]|nr:hypothetical protein LTR28_003633 [Elasticomyces elasticus]